MRHNAVEAAPCRGSQVRSCGPEDERDRATES
jgi:hypothetical protein